MLDLKDPRINFDKNFCIDEKIRGITAKVFYGVLTEKPEACPHCGHVFDGNIIRYGFKSTRITLPKVSGFNAYLKLKKQRFLCRHCQSTFLLSTPIVNPNCFISRNTKAGIALLAKDKISEKDIARGFNVSAATVKRTIDNYYLYYKPKKNYLPKHLCFDEFKSVKEAAGSMSFLFCDAETGRLIDLVENRRLYFLENYFRGYTRAARRSVRSVVIDMYAPYITLIKKVFPNAKIIFDRFHMVQLFSRSLLKTRIKTMNQYPAYYTKFKNNWKLFQKDLSKIDFLHSWYNRNYRKCMRQSDILDDLLGVDASLEATYYLYQTILSCIRNRDHTRLKEALLSADPLISNEMKTSVKTALRYIEYFSNGLKYEYSNGKLEGINNKIKVIKRISFGYRSYLHFRNRILISFNVSKLKAA
jgi:transposase